MMNIMKDIVLTVLGYLKADWMILLVGILMAVSINVYVDSDKLKKSLEKNSFLSIPGSVAFGALTPLCACGTMAVLLSMFISSMPWGPVMAFLVSSPLTSPSGFMFQASFLGTPFAVAMLVASILLGLSAGFVASYLDKRTNFFKNQFKLIQKKSQDCCGSSEVEVMREIASCCSHEVEVEVKEHWIKKYKLDEFAKGLYNLGFKKVLVNFMIFIAIGRVVEMIIPSEWILGLFSSEKSYSVALGATVGLPLYISSSAALPLVKSFINSGAGEGAVLAFLITGKATGIPVIAGMSTILNKKAMLFYVGAVYLGGILSGYAYQIFLELIQ